jgi:bifunctional non-homologous end joining protein LigD
MNISAESVIRRAARDVPVTLQLFDLLWLEGRSAMPLAYTDRRRLLASLTLDGPHWQTPAYHAGDGEAMLAFTRDRGLEGVVAKRLDSAYEPGRRSSAWLKIKSRQLRRVVIGGYVLGDGSRSGRIGALVVGVRDDDGRLVYAGRAGSGLSERAIDELEAMLGPLRRPTHPFAAGRPPRDAIFVEPRYGCAVEFTEWTASGTLRHPIFKGEVAPVEEVR